MRQRRASSLLSAVLCLCLCALVLGSTTATNAAEPTKKPTSPADTLAQLRSDLDESSQAMVDAASNLQLAEAALPGAKRTAAETHRLLLAAQRRQAAAAHRRGSAQVQLIVATQDTEALAGRVAAQHDRIGRLARAVYQSGGSMSDLSMLLESQSPTDFAERMVAFQTVLDSQRSALDDLKSVETTYVDRTDALEHVRDQLAAADEQAQRELAVIAGLEARAQAAAAEVQRLLTARDAAVAAATAASAVDAAQGQVQQGSQTSLQAQLVAQARQLLGAAGARAGSTVAPVPGTLSWPAHGPITSPFGMRVHPITGVRKLHTGTDLGVPCGTQVHAAREGTVLSAGWDTAYGFRTVVSHGVVNGALLTTTYNHQSHIGVTVGQHVDVGQLIGISGTTGYSTGCHLHFELLVNGDFVDPMPWMTRL
jgi:murein DD-endopeptidase MepM/ murein hydrolase activator NlpD